MLAAVIDLSHPGRYIHWGWFQMSLANLIVIAVEAPVSEGKMWTARLRSNGEIYAKVVDLGFDPPAVSAEDLSQGLSPHGYP